jgi:hypothetical protein
MFRRRKKLREKIQLRGAKGFGKGNFLAGEQMNRDIFLFLLLK